MTLKEKFEEIELDGSNTFLSESDSEKFEQISDDYAIEFAQWIVKNCNHSKLKYLDYKELLEILKKEKGL
jgi:hypothetical protein